MSYIGNNPTSPAVQSLHQVLDAITFDGVASTFPLTVGAVVQFPGLPANVIITINGVLQAPVDAYSISGSNIVFTSIPTASSSFSGIILSTTYQTNIPLAGSVGAEQLQFGSVDLAGTKVTGILPIVDGGTGSSSAGGALIGLGAQPALVSGTSIKTVNSTSLLGSGNISAQENLVSGTNIKTINSVSLLGSGNITSSEIGATSLGDIISTSNTLNAPDYLPCDGSVYLQSSYPTLFSKIGLVTNGSYAHVATTLPQSAQWGFSAFGAGTFVVGSSSTSLSYVLATSTDGASWTTRSAALSGTRTSLIFGGGLFVGSISEASSSVETSPNGITWTSRSMPASKSWASLAYGNGIFFAKASDLTAATSTDGITWTTRSTPISTTKVVFGSGLFMMLEQSASTNYYTSPDGITWTLRILPSAQSVNNFTYGNGQFILYSGTSILFSKDGLVWNSYRSSHILGNLFAESGMYFSGASSASLTTGYLTSTDGVNWSLGSSILSYPGQSIVYGNGFFIIFSASATTSGARVQIYTYNTATQFATPSIPQSFNTKTYIKSN